MINKTHFTIQCGHREPRLLCLDANVDWDNFPDFATHLSGLLEARITDQQWGADLHVWQLDFEGSRLSLQFETNSDSLWLTLDRDDEVDVMDFLVSLLQRKLAGINHA